MFFISATYTLEKRAATNAESPAVLVFKTDIQTPCQRQRVVAALQLLSGISQCWVDIEDCDKVLRVEGTAPQAQVEKTVRTQGFWIEELMD